MRISEASSLGTRSQPEPILAGPDHSPVGGEHHEVEIDRGEEEELVEGDDD